VARVIGQDGANTLPNAEKRIGMGAGSIKSGLMEPIKILILIVLAAIVVSLGSALFHLSSGKGDSKKMARALTIRVGLSLALFILLIVAWANGLISPHGLKN
jgi:cytochrome bd-type quinol oxidase subunit 2